MYTREYETAAARTARLHARRPIRYARITAPAALVAAWPEGKDALTSQRRSGSASGSRT
jgi:hypothetical protein